MFDLGAADDSEDGEDALSAKFGHQELMEGPVTNHALSNHFARV